MKLQEALETLRLHAQDYAAPRDLRDAVEAVTTYFENHPVVSAKDFFAALEGGSELLRQAKARETKQMLRDLAQRRYHDHP
jgi:hypothetical protein